MPHVVELPYLRMDKVSIRIVKELCYTNRTDRQPFQGPILDTYSIVELLSLRMDRERLRIDRLYSQELNKRCGSWQWYDSLLNPYESK